MLSAVISLALVVTASVSAASLPTVIDRFPALPSVGVFSECSRYAATSCRNKTVQADLCCFNAPGGQFLLTQFWDFAPAVGPADAWTIHGLWPDRCDGTYDANCAPERQLSNITAVLQQSGHQDLLDYMNTYWLDSNGKNEQFWEHEYNKHGTCISTLNPECFQKTPSEPFPELTTYMTKTVELHQGLPTFKWLEAAGIVPSTSATYNLTQIQDALASQTGFAPTVGCDKKGYLTEMWYHYVVQGSVGSGKFFNSAPDGVKSSCPGTGIKYVPKGTTLSPA